MIVGQICKLFFINFLIIFLIIFLDSFFHFFEPIKFFRIKISKIKS
nr:MAG TPA: hypothetical protein [Caudoviricetes sp.]